MSVTSLSRHLEGCVANSLHNPTPCSNIDLLSTCMLTVKDWISNCRNNLAKAVTSKRKRVVGEHQEHLL